MKLAIMQPYFLPYIGYFQLINAVDVFVFLDDVNFIKSGWINRNRILNHGLPHIFTLDLVKPSQNKLINETIRKDNTEKLIKTIQFCYGKAPGFLKVFPLLQKILRSQKLNLAKFASNSIEETCAFIGLKKKILFSSKIEKDSSLRAQNKIIEICKLLGANQYINFSSGRYLYSYDFFKNNNIQLSFIKTDSIIYKQFSNEFIPDLSIIDILMFNEVNKIKGFLDSFTLES
jgi:hypothetical protein